MANVNPQSLLGKSEMQVAGDALLLGINFRIVSRDGVALPIVEDYVPTRWDLSVERGIIVGVSIPQHPTAPK